MLHRTLALPLHRAAQRGEAVLVQGPRGSGKTALLRREFPGHVYITLEDAKTRTRARTEPSRFLGSLRGPAIIDDLHRAPELLTKLQDQQGPWIFASSRRLAWPATLELHRPTRAELQRRPPLPLAMLGRFSPAVSPTGAYTPWPATNDYLARDVRDLVQVQDADRFEAFVNAAQARSGELLDQQELARACSLSHRTVVRWLAVLDACFRTLLLPPASLDLGRRVVRRPRLHFLDSPVFASEVVSEIYRNAVHAGERPDLRHWSDSNGFALPLIIESETLPPVPVGWAESPSELTRLKRWMALAQVSDGALIGRTRTLPGMGGIARYGLSDL
ncbi:MAG: ATP-binding protein [Bryobacteraceae bacterium]|nr:ATP-binding protein [Bryobacteraceae bacterium]